MIGHGFPLRAQNNTSGRKFGAQSSLGLGFPVVQSMMESMNAIRPLGEKLIVGGASSAIS
jgi:hypothetical protein